METNNCPIFKAELAQKQLRQLSGALVFSLRYISSAKDCAPLYLLEFMNIPKLVSMIILDDYIFPSPLQNL